MDTSTPDPNYWESLPPLTSAAFPPEDDLPQIWGRRAAQRPGSTPKYEFRLVYLGIDRLLWFRETPESFIEHLLYRTTQNLWESLGYQMHWDSDVENPFIFWGHAPREVRVALDLNPATIIYSEHQENSR